MMTGLVSILAMAPPIGDSAPEWAKAMNTLLFPVLIFVVFYFMLIRPQQKKQKETQKMLESLRSGDKIVTSGGIFGTVTNVKEKTIVVRIADNVKVEMLRSAIQTVTQRTNEDDQSASKN
ncbi:MAG: preprotein translocase subunit YajC [Verrucomicrobia bacterium]|nr:preprotein translocase subunit YajC [Verrucomicrobiota bacterium]